MYKRISARLTAASSPAPEERKYILEDVFWVPESNCRARHFTLPIPPEPDAEVCDIKSNSSKVESESDL